MKCKLCKKNVIIPQRSYLYLDTYNVGGSCVVASECCGAGYEIEMKVSYKTMPYKGNKTIDDWGDKMKPIKNK